MPFLIEDDSTTAAGFPHSEICGSKVTCTSPQLIAAYRVLLRLIWPRHPPYALTYLTSYDVHRSSFIVHRITSTNDLRPTTNGSILRFVKISFKKEVFSNIFMQLSRYESRSSLFVHRSSKITSTYNERPTTNGPFREDDLSKLNNE